MHPLIIITHLIPVFIYNWVDVTYQIQSLAESLEDLSDVSTLLHGDQSGVVLLVDPH